VFYYANEILDKNSLGWKGNGFQWKNLENKREGQGGPLDVIDKTHKEIQMASLSLHFCLLFLFVRTEWCLNPKCSTPKAGNEVMPNEAF